MNTGRNEYDGLVASVLDNLLITEWQSFSCLKTFSSLMRGYN
jgi:hypothetical protein